MSVPKNRRYGCWGGNRAGLAEDKDRCVESIWHNHSPGGYGDQCSRKRGYGPNGEFCKQHDPGAIAKKKADCERRWALDRKAEDERWERQAYDRLAGNYCRGIGMSKEQLEAITLDTPTA